MVNFYCYYFGFSDNYNYNNILRKLLKGLKRIGSFFMFIVGGFIAIIVGSFMIRGTMHLWDKSEAEDKKEK